MAQNDTIPALINTDLYEWQGVSGSLVSPCVTGFDAACVCCPRFSCCSHQALLLTFMVRCWRGDMAACALSPGYSDFRVLFWYCFSKGIKIFWAGTIAVISKVITLVLWHYFLLFPLRGFFWEFFLTLFEGLRGEGCCPFIIKIVLFRSKTWQTIWFYSVWFFTAPVNEYATREDRMNSVFSESIFSHKSLFLCVV